MDQQLENLQWPVPFTTSTTSSDANRCIQNWMGGNMKGSKNWGSLVKGGTEASYQYTGASGSQISPHNIYKKSKLKISSFSDRQYNSIVVSPKNGGNKESCLDTAEQGHMVYITNQRDHNYCRIPTQFTECSSGSGISYARINRMEIASKGICVNMQKVGHTITRPVCFTGEPSNPRLCSVEAGLIQPRDRCISTGLVRSIPVCIPAILPF